MEHRRPLLEHRVDSDEESIWSELPPDGVRINREDAALIETPDHLVEENLGLAGEIAKNFRGNGLPYDDLNQAGRLGLITAAKAFDAGRGYRFSTLACPCISH